MIILPRDVDLRKWSREASNNNSINKIISPEQWLHGKITIEPKDSSLSQKRSPSTLEKGTKNAKWMSLPPIRKHNWLQSTIDHGDSRIQNLAQSSHRRSSISMLAESSKSFLNAGGRQILHRHKSAPNIVINQYDMARAVVEDQKQWRKFQESLRNARTGFTSATLNQILAAHLAESAAELEQRQRKLEPKNVPSEEDQERPRAAAFIKRSALSIRQNLRRRSVDYSSMESVQDSSIPHLNEYIERWTVVEKKKKSQNIIFRRGSVN